MDDEELAALERLEQSATPGPWISSVEGRDHWAGDNVILTSTGSARGPDIYVDIRVLDDGWHPGAVADQDFIAAARNAIPGLIAEIRRLRGDADQP